MSQFTRSQTQVIYNYLPGALFEHDRYGICLVTDIICEPANEVNRSALLEAVYDVLQSWRSPAGQLPPHFPDPRLEADQYFIGVPRDVRFIPFPTILECQRCGQIESLDGLQKHQGQARCLRAGCSGSYRQLPLVQIHHCGRIEPITIRSCKLHGQHALTFMTTGRVASCTWRCEVCGGATLGSMRMTPCACEWARQPNSPGDRYMRNVRTNDSSVFYAQARSFVNLKEDKLDLLRRDHYATGLLLARAWGLLPDRAIHLVEKRAYWHREGQSKGAIDPLIEQMIDQLGRDNPLVQQYLERQAEAEALPGQKAVDQVAALLDKGAVVAPPSRRLVEHVAILDTLESWRVEDVIRMAQGRDDLLGELAAREALAFARQHLGLADIRCLFDFPMALCAVGFTRSASTPGRATLLPFQVTSAQDRTPIYVLSADTEAVMFQLNPLRVAGWLHRNGFVGEAAPAAGEEAVAGWAWLRRHVPQLSAERWQEAWHIAPARAVRTLLHTISHLLLRHVEWSGFDPESIGEYILPETLSLILYTNRYTGFTIGGLVTLFEQRLLNWLEATRSEGFSCLYDPFCRDEGGSCAGCLHRRYNCDSFNQELSRAVLYGGLSPDGHDIEHGYWEL